MKFSLATVVALASAVLAAPTVETPIDNGLAGPDPSKVTIAGIKYNGSGCPIGSVQSILTADKTAFTLLMSEYSASIGTGTPSKEWSKNCQINVDLRYPQGWQFSLFEATYRGTAVLEAGVTGTQTALYYFSGATQDKQCKAFTTIKGPYNDLYKLTDTIAFETLVWSPCGANGLLNINSNVRLNNFGTPKGGSGLLTTESIDGTFKQQYGVQWRRC